MAVNPSTLASLSSLSAVWADNMKLDALNAATKVNSSTVGSTQGTDPQRFWSTPERDADDESEETMEVTLSSERLVNHIQFDLAKFPHDAEVEYFDVQIGDWRPLLRGDSTNGEPCSYSVLECNPPVLPPVSAIDGHNHPQHSFSGHWQPAEFLCRPVRFQRLRVVLKRHRRSQAPCNSRGVRMAFSLAIRGLYCGYKVYSQACVPAPQPVLASYTEHQEIATTTDLLGSQVSYVYRVNRASNILLNDPDTPGTTLIWRSEPQPFPQAVVNYFLDVRDSDGEPQVLDRIFLDPINDGPNVNLYYSNDEPEAGFVAPDDPLPPQVAVPAGQLASTDPLGTATQPYGRVGWIDIDNSPISFRPGRKWWFGARLNWRFLRALDSAEHPIFDCGAFHFAWTQYGLRFGTGAGDYFHVDVDRFDPATDFTFMSWYSGTTVRTQIRIAGQDFFGERELSVSLSTTTVAKIRVAGFLNSTSISADFRLQHMVLKVDQDVHIGLINDFLSNPAPYCVKPEFSVNDDGRTDNAILRYNPGFVNQDFPTGLKGGAPTKYSSMEWSPIARDYTLRKGFLYFPPTKAKYWKLEFCALTPEPYEVYVPIKKTVKTYRTEMWMVPVAPPVVAARIAIIVPGISVSVNIAASFDFRSSTSVQVNASAGSVSVKGYSATSVRVATSVSVAVSLSTVSWVWGFLPAHPPTYVPRFETKCVHEYDVIEVETKTKIGYFVGLKGIQAYKVSYLAVDDTNQYTELFHDDSNLSSDTGWSITGDHELTSGDSHFAQAESRIMPSNRIVRAVQFATTQSAPTQLLPDDDFDDEDPDENWRAIGDGTLAPFTTTDERVGSILRVDRGSREPSWDEMLAQLYPTWSAVEGRTWEAVERSGNPAQSVGGIESKAPASTPPGGRIYAAARVIAPHDLQSPLYVQIIDDETGQVLSESSAEVKAGQIAEWFTSYTIGEGGELRAWRWKDFSTSPAYPTYVDNFARANATTLGNLLTNQAWLTNGTSHQISSNEALTVVDGSYDYVDALTPWGTLEMSIGTMGSGTNRALLHFSPINIDDQGVVTYSGGRSAFPTTTVLGRAAQIGDTIRVDIMPMSQVPTNRRPAGWTDNVTTPYALLFYLNGTWVTTLGHRLGSRTRRGFLGRVNQRYRSFSWTPSALGVLPGPVMALLPVTGNGSFDTGRLTWTDNEGSVWSTTGTLDNSTTAGVLTFTSAGARIVTDTRYWYGSLSAGVRTVAAGTVGKHGDVLVLDADSVATLNAAGNVIENGTNRGNLVPGGVSNNSLLQVQFLDTKSVAASVRGSIDPVVFPKMLRALVNGTQVGVLAFASMQNWQGTKRGLAGDVYDGAAGTPIADFHTSFDCWNWAPDASNVAVDPKTPKWDEVSQKATGTYDSMAHFLTLNNGKLRARVVQRGASIDVWDMDTLSLFADPIVWSFSNDGGLNFYNAFDIKNDPHGVMVFPEGVILTATTGTAQAGSNPGQSLVWRVVSYAPNQKISSLTIRPWYGGLLSGITHRVGLAAGGPNKMPYDHYPPIEEDARFQLWSRPVPQDWYYQFRILKRSVDEVVPRPKVLLLPEALTSKYKSEQGG
jgi:hypothetical protein